MEEHNVSNESASYRRKRRRGGQPGNRNGVKHGFYSSFLSARDRRKLMEARGIEGVRDDLDFMRVKLGTLASNPNVTLGQVAAALNAIARLASVNHRISRDQLDREGLAESLAGVVNSIGAALGIDDPPDDWSSGGGESRPF